MQEFNKIRNLWLDQKHDEHAPVMDGVIVIKSQQETAECGLNCTQLDSGIWKFSLAVINAPATVSYGSHILHRACEARSVTAPLRYLDSADGDASSICGFRLGEKRPAFLVHHIVDYRNETFVSTVQEGVFKASEAMDNREMTDRMFKDKKKISQVVEFIINKKKAEKDFLFHGDNAPDSRKPLEQFTFSATKKHCLYMDFMNHVAHCTNHAFSNRAERDDKPYIYVNEWDQKGKPVTSEKLYSIEPTYHRTGYDSYTHAIWPLRRIVDFSNQYNTAASLNDEMPPLSNANMLYIANMANAQRQHASENRKSVNVEIQRQKYPEIQRQNHKFIS